MSNSRSPRAVRSMTMGTRGMTSAYPPSGDDHRRALEAAVAEIVERLLGAGELVHLDRRPDRDAPRELEELDPVLAGQVGHRADLALAVEQVVGEGRDVGHVDPGAHDHP